MTGGSWQDPLYLFSEVGSVDPSTASRALGFRTVWLDPAPEDDHEGGVVEALAAAGIPLVLLDRPVRVTDADFRQTIEGTAVPVLVDFYADWCGPCKVMAPTLDALARDRRGEVLVAKLDTDANPVTAGGFGIRAIPTLIVFRDGVEVARETGAVPRHRLDALIEQAEAGAAAGA